MASINLQGDTSGSISISAPSVAGSNTLTLPATTQTLATQNALGVRNLIINGDMRIAQRGTSASGLTGTAYSTVDRWQTVCATLGTWTESQSTDAPNGFSNSLKFECTTADASPAAGDVCLVNQRVEGNMLPSLAFGTSSAKTVTLSFYVKSNKTGTFAVGFRNIDNSKAIGGNYTINSANTWEQKTFTFEGDTVSGFTIDNSVAATVEWFLGAGTDYTSGTMPTSWATTVTANRAAGQNVNIADTIGNTFYITGVQLEVGDTATPFEHRPYDMELARCQRYYEKSCAYATVPNNGVYDVEYLALSNYIDNLNCKWQASFKVEKRATPTLTLYGGATSKWQTAKLDGSWGTIIGSSYAVSLTTKYVTVNNSDWNGSSSWQTITAGTGRMTRGVWVVDCEL